MRTILLLILLFCCAPLTYAQENLSVISQNRIFSISSYYQSWEIDNARKIDEISTPIFLYLPFGYAFNISVHASSANVTGDGLPGITSFTDTQVSMNYHIESANLLLSLGLNVPSGKKEYTLDEFASSSLISYSVFGFRVPNFGEGFGIAPGFTWAIPLGEDVVAGIGATYQRKNGFKPIASFNANYVPGDEILATAGLDFRLSQSASLSTDVLFTSYGVDKMGDRELFTSGKKWLLNLQFRKYFRFNELWFFARYRSRAKNRLVQAGRLIDEREKTTPDQIDFMAHYRMRLGSKMSFRILAEGRFFQVTSSDFSGATLVGLGIMPEISISNNFTLPIRLLFFSGELKNQTDLSGFEVGLGAIVNF
ncbi:MAG: hypothetical protein ACE5I1_08975 [bacterium]